MKVRTYFKITEIHQLEVDTSRYPSAPQDDPDAFADWLEARGGFVAREEMLERKGRSSWVDTEDEVEITDCVVLGSADDQ